jgi:hypothetical protein
VVSVGLARHVEIGKITMAEDEPLFLFIGNSDREAAVSKLKASGIRYRRKMLESRPENWDSIALLLESSHLKGVVGKLTSYVYDLMTRPVYSGRAVRILNAISRTPHSIFVHESILTGEEYYPELESGEYLEEDYEESIIRTQYLSPPAEDVRIAVNKLLEEHRINVVPYKTNAEMSVLTVAFIEDIERNLLFRVYVPSGRLYATEADKLINLFQDWLSQVGKRNVRQDGYRTSAGQVYEFFGDDSSTSRGLSRDFDDFSNFLGLCIEDPEAAAQTLMHTDLDRRSISKLVAKYGREGTRLQLDLKHERESRLLTIRHSLELELLEMKVDKFPSDREMAILIDQMLPDGSDFKTMIRAGGAPIPIVNSGMVDITINQQIIKATEGAIIQNIQGVAHLSAEAKELIDLARRYGDEDAGILESAIYELEDPGARRVDRMGARQRIKGFLLRLGDRAEDIAIKALMAYIECKIGF